MNERRRKGQGGYPEAPKRQKYEDQRIGASKIAQFFLNEVLTPGREEWLDTHALRGVSALTGKVVRGGRMHSRGRRSLFDCETHQKDNRLSILFSENGPSKLIDDNVTREMKMFRQTWVGATFFYEDRP